MISPDDLVKELFDSSGVRTASNRGRGMGKYLAKVAETGKYAGKIATYPIIHPRESLSYIKSELKDKRLPLSVLLASRSGDIITTLIGVNRYGHQRELNPLVRNLMESYGPLEGLLIHTAILLPPSIAVLYGYGKYLGYFYEQYRHYKGKSVNEKAKRLLENAPLYISAAIWVVVTINNAIIAYL